MKAINRLNIAKYIYLTGFLGLAIGLPASKVALSIGMMLMALGVLLEWNLPRRFKNLFSNRLFLVLFLFWMLHLVAMLWTDNFAYAYNDIRIKISLLVIPILIYFDPFKQKHLNIWFFLFIATLVFTAIFNFLQYHGILLNQQHHDIRGLSFFGSHIRYGILIAIGAGWCLVQIDRSKKHLRWLWFILFLFFSFYTYYSQILSGAIGLVAVIFIYISWKGFGKNKIIGWSLIVSLLIIAVSGVTYLSMHEKPKIDLKNLPKVTKLGNPYSHNLKPTTFVEGKAVLAYVCEKELKEAWNNASEISYDSLDLKKQPLRFTLMRYLTSKDLTKDKEGMSHLSAKDIKLIEKGITSSSETEAGLFSRISGLRYQLHNSSDPNGHSLLQRLEYWKTALSIIKKHWLFGVGTGDVDDAFQNEYNTCNSPLTEQHRLRAHNMYLTTWVSFGVFGILLFSMLLCQFFIQSLREKNLFGILFISVACITFLFEDTLETQTGASFFAIFFGLALLQFESKSKSFSESMN
jgi:hypothetical protein